MLKFCKMLFTPARILAFGLPALLLIGQQSAPVFRAGSKLVEVEVTVLDKKGNPVTGLAQADFTLRDEGKPQSIAFFHFDGTQPPAREDGAAPDAAYRDIFSNRAESAESLNVTALLLDGINTPPDQNMARARRRCAT